MIAGTRKSTARVILVALGAWYFANLCVVAGVHLSPLLVLRKPPEVDSDLLGRVMRFDALHYRSIVTDGYHYREEKRSNVAFFPAYPLLSMMLTAAGFESKEAMLIVANVLLLGVIILFPFYLSTRPLTYGVEPHPLGDMSCWAVVSFLLWPPTFFLRMPYAESCFCFFALLTLYGISRRWPLVIVGLLAGAATATRPVGVAVSAAVWWHVLSSHVHRSDRTTWDRVRRGGLALAWVVPLSCWGLVIYSVYLWWTFDAPMAFAQTQAHWNYLAPREGGWWEKMSSLLTFEPIRGVFDHQSLRWWVRGEDHGHPLYSMLFWNPIYYLTAWLLIGLGLFKRWLTGPEVVMSVMLLLIPYLTRSYEMSMASHARFSAVVLPQYFVLGRILMMLPPSISGCLCGLLGLMVGLWTALFASGYRFF